MNHKRKTPWYRDNPESGLDVDTNPDRDAQQNARDNRGGVRQVGGGIIKGVRILARKR